MDKKVILVEDDHGVARVIKDKLTQKQYEVHHYCDAETFLHQFDLNNPGVFLIDLTLPGINGYSVVRRIRKHSPLYPLIILSDQSEDKDVLEGLRLGADDYLIKPLDMNELAARVNAAWEKFFLLFRLQNPANTPELCKK